VRRTWTLHRLPQLIDARRKSGKPQVDISFPEVEKFDHLPPARVEGATAFVSIMEGCSKYCSFCVVPYTRGEEISRGIDSVLTEVAELALQGVKEITLLGQNVNAYAAKTDEGATADFALLLEYVAEIPGIERIRYTTSHPKEFTQRLIDAYATNPKLVSQVHLPVQSGSDRVLAAMKRGYTVLEYKSIIRRLRAVRPDISISSDFIVGFPGETEADFEATIKLIHELKFDGSYNFVYSRRPGTPAADLADDTPEAVKLSRVQRLQGVVDEQLQRYSQAMIGTRQPVLVTGHARREGQLAGRTGNNRVINFDGPATLINQFVEITITEALRYTLRGKLTGDTQAAA
jgi:tRNA-2-methylthio-N6-dimethylallyladenosine synthase